jgi:uncharacterized Zn-binding protein involved in type VI secretion
MKYSIPTPLSSNVAILIIIAVCLIGQGSVASAVELLNRAVTDNNRGVIKVNPLAQNIQLSLTYPAGKSPKVFTKGWVFGASCLVNPGTRDQVDNSGNVRWKGTGTFTPDRGPLSRPVFNGPGTNAITLYVEKDGKIVCEKTFTVEAVDPRGYARVGGMVQCPVYALGCPACPHDVKGPILSGSPIVFIDGIPAARAGDTGVHAGGCGPTTFVIKTGDPGVLIDGKPAARVGDQTQHSGGMGRIINAAGK